MDAFQQQAINVVLVRAREVQFDNVAGTGGGTRCLWSGTGSGNCCCSLFRRFREEAGAGFVTLNNGYWDFHDGIIPGCNNLCPKLDHAVAAFMEDVRSRGLEDNILLLITGEFGRSPRLGGGPGRDHWAPLNDAVLIGGGLRMGQVVGESDSRGGHVLSRFGLHAWQSCSPQSVL